MKTYIIPKTDKTLLQQATFICGGSPGADITGDAPGIEGGGTGMAPFRYKDLF